MLLEINPGLAIWTLITFILLLIILKKFAWKPILETVEKRENTIRESLEKAEKAKQEAEESLQKYEDMLKSAREDSRKLIEKGKIEAETVKNQIVEDARKQAESLLEKAKNEIEGERKKAVGAIQSMVIAISTDIAAKIIQKELKREDYEQLILDSLDQYEKAQS